MVREIVSLDMDTNTLIVFGASFLTVAYLTVKYGFKKPAPPAPTVKDYSAWRKNVDTRWSEN